jgi:hypothetical protein
LSGQLEAFVRRTPVGHGQDDGRYPAGGVLGGALRPPLTP